MSSTQYAIRLPDASFDGATYDPEKDHDRLRGQMLAVFELMRDGQWRTLGEIEAATEAPQASISARLRDLRKPKFGGYQVDMRRRSRGLFEYRLWV